MGGGELVLPTMGGAVLTSHQRPNHITMSTVTPTITVVRGRFPFGTLKQKVMEVKGRYGSSTLLIEDSPISRGLIQSLREQSINVTISKPETDKRARVIAQTDLFAGGSVRFPRRAEWLEECIAEILAFPGRHDDQVDALTQGLAWGRQRNLVPRIQFRGY